MWYLNPDAKIMVLIIARLIANNHAFLQCSHVSKSKANTLRAFMNVQCSSYTMTSPWHMEIRKPTWIIYIEIVFATTFNYPIKDNWSDVKNVPWR